jgi:hypothetical protein
MTCKLGHLLMQTWQSGDGKMVERIWISLLIHWIWKDQLEKDKNSNVRNINLAK